MTPSDITTLIHIHCRTDGLPNHDAPAVIDTILQFSADGIIEPANDRTCGYQTTDRGKALIQLLCQTPLPQTAFIDPRTQETIA